LLAKADLVWWVDKQVNQRVNQQVNEGDRMMSEAKNRLECPTCGEPAAAPAGAGGKSPRPFCSKRCADIDLGRWFQGRYAIPAVDAADDSLIEAMAEAHGQSGQTREDQ